MEEKKIIAYKGFDKDFKCRGFQYEVGKTYETDKAVPCECGFHACANPFDVLEYYNDINGKYCIVEQSGEIVEDNDKTASTKIHIKADIGFVGLFKAGIEWLKEVTSSSKVKDSTLNDNGGGSAKIASSGGYATIASSGSSAKIASSGSSAKIASSGYSATIASSGYSATIASSGGSAKIASSGGSAKIASSGSSAKIASSGGYATIASSGGYATIASSGGYAKIASSGDYAKIASSGGYATIASSGSYATIASSGGYAKIASSGDSAKIASSGDSAKIDSTGEDSVICCAGYASIVKAKEGSWITLSEWEYSEEKERYTPVCVKTEQVDGERIKADTWYRLVNGEFQEVNNG